MEYCKNTVKELKNICKSNNKYKGYSKYSKKDDLINFMMNIDNTNININIDNTNINIDNTSIF